MKTPLYNTDTLEHILHAGNHDTVTWLSSISGLAYIVLQQADNLTDEQRDWVKSIHDAATRCRRMNITKWSVITNIIADVFYEPAEPIVLMEVIADVIGTLNANVQYGSRPVVIEVHADPALAPIRVNRRRLHYCLHTVMTEFQHTMPSNPGRIYLIAQPEAIEIIMEPLDIINAEHGDMLTLMLADNGGDAITLHERRLRFLLKSEQADE